MYGRGEYFMEMSANGEIYIQNCVMDGWGRTAEANEGLIFFDVGAHVGHYAASVLNLSKNKFPEKLNDIKLYLFEPSPGTRETLIKNLRDKLGLLDLYIEDVAISSKTGTTNIYINKLPDCGTNSLENDPEIIDKNALTIKTYTAFDYCEINNIKKIQLLKVDTEGHDYHVITGAFQLLTQERISVLQFEYNHRWINSKHFIKDVFVLMEKLPYKIAKIQSTHLLVYNRWHFELERFFECNYVLVHEGCLNWFRVKFVDYDFSNTPRYI